MVRIGRVLMINREDAIGRPPVTDEAVAAGVRDPVLPAPGGGTPTIVGQVWLDRARITATGGPLRGPAARTAVPLAAILMPAGSFPSSAGRGRTEPNALVGLVYLGAASLGLGVVALGIGLVTA